MRKLLKYLKDYKKQTVLAPLFKLLEACFDLFVPLVIASIINTGIANNDTGYIVKMCALLLVMGIVGLAFSLTAQYFAAAAAVGFSTKLKHALFEKIQSFSYSEIDKIGPSTLITRMTSDTNQLQNGVNLTLRLFLRSPFIVFGAVALAFTVDVKAALIFAVAIPLLSAVVFGIMLLTMPLYKKVQRKLDSVLTSTRENLSGVRVIRAFCREDIESEEFKEHNNSLNSIQKFVGKLSALMNPLTYVIINIAIIALLKVGAIQVNSGVLESGDVVALYNYMSQILVELIKLANLILSITKALACATRISAVLDTENSLEHVEASNADTNSEYKVEFRNVCLKYHGSGAESLSNITFSVLPGQTVGIIGGTGSGKTSLVNLIPHFYDSTDGEVLVNGKNVKAYGDEELRSIVGLVPQKAVLFKGTIRENMLWGDEGADDETIYEALKIAQADEIVKSKDRGLDSNVEMGGKNFSGGQRQRLTIARALVRRPEILILDDSASALDYATDAKLRHALKNMPSPPTIFIVSQRTSSISHADKIIVLDDGEMCGIGTHEELLESCKVYREIYESQFTKEGA
jgi:ATP-binding cassette subfamily B multidrug efflux pump